MTENAPARPGRAPPVPPASPRPARIRLLLPLALIVGLTALALAPTGNAAEPAPDDWADEPRQVSAWPAGGGFAVRSVRDSALADDLLQADYDAAAAQLTVRLSGSEPGPADLDAVLGLRAVTEFRDLDGDGRLGPGDEVVRRVAIPGTPAIGHVEPLPQGGWRASAVHTLPAASTGLAAGPARLELVLDARAAPEDGKSPTRLDLAVRVLDGWARNGTHLALETSVASDPAPLALGADAVRLGSGGLSLAAAWQDGRGTVTEASGQSAASFVRSQPAGPDVTFPATVSAAWRPAADASGGAVGSPGFYVGAAIVGMAALAVPAWKRLHG